MTFPARRLTDRRTLRSPTPAAPTTHLTGGASSGTSLWSSSRVRPEVSRGEVRRPVRQTRSPAEGTDTRPQRSAVIRIAAGRPRARPPCWHPRGCSAARIRRPGGPWATCQRSGSLPRTSSIGRRRRQVRPLAMLGETVEDLAARLGMNPTTLNRSCWASGGRRSRTSSPGCSTSASTSLPSSTRPTSSSHRLGPKHRCRPWGLLGGC